MDTKNLIESFAEFAKQKNVDRPTMIRILEDVFRTMIRKKFVTDDNFDIVINADKGDLEIWRFRGIVDDNSEDIWEHDKISLSEAKKIEPDFEVGEEVSEEIKLEDFGRRAVMTARQTLMQRIKDLEKDLLFQKYKELVGELIMGEVYQVLNREVLLIDAEGNELILPKTEQISKDKYRKGETVRAVVQRVEMVNGNPRIILSRTSPKFLERLFESEVPEVFDGLITIRNIVREPGERAKVAVESYDDRIDPVGACVGMKGSRIHSIVRELQNENIDVISYTDNLELFIQRALSPAKISSIKIDKEGGRVSVYMKPDQVSLAIGKGGHNIKLASKLVGYEIDVFRDINDGEDEDVDLDEFSDEIENWIIDELKRVGLDTAKSVLALSPRPRQQARDLVENRRYWKLSAGPGRHQRRAGRAHGHLRRMDPHTHRHPPAVHRGAVANVERPRRRGEPRGTFGGARVRRGDRSHHRSHCDSRLHLSEHGLHHAGKARGEGLRRVRHPGGLQRLRLRAHDRRQTDPLGPVPLRPDRRQRSVLAHPRLERPRHCRPVRRRRRRRGPQGGYEARHLGQRITRRRFPREHPFGAGKRLRREDCGLPFRADGRTSGIQVRRESSR